MPIRSMASFAVAIFLGLIALLLVRNFLVSHAAAEAGPTQSTVPVVVAAAPIARGATLNASMLKVVRYPRESVPQGAFSTPAALAPGGAGASRSALRDIGLDEPVVASKVSVPGVHATLASALQPGMRAVSVKSSDVSGVGGFVLPGDRVDVLVTRQTGTGMSASSIVQVLADNVLVLGVDQSSDANKPVVAKAVTLQVSPEEAQAISLAQAVGSVTLALRETSDGLPLSRRTMTVADLAPGDHHARPARPRVRIAHAARPAGNDVRVTRGLEVATYTTFD
ncbi:Flp pilus assembly protein CpaB [Phenylobacterium soli]|uniref:Flp pilus assembly protein CpaB n=2 Tax=Phenylobacterium soli TaxID=2170551 RepID=A0A328ANI0_9CAUL|nr:Flp pilus assembly protein CpaB [Phenylobacterium soli]